MKDEGLGIGAGRRLHYKADLFWIQYLDLSSLLPGDWGLGEKPAEIDTPPLL